MRAKWVQSVAGLALDAVLASGILASFISIVVFLLLARDWHYADLQTIATTFLLFAGILYALRHFRRRAYGFAEVGFALGFFAYALFTMNKPTDLMNLMFQCAAAIYVAIRGFDNIVLFHKNRPVAEKAPIPGPSCTAPEADCKT
ncbi:hypothetical protein QA635_38850 [Bradyrhizobium brasilense]|uniref:hypothetical protein n=1 Tax=Bradyrhizobium brasilense TaxID=1419277 RepID=UPI0024B0D774|nr:hypothetical protein [Bradyrhizobium australafricanum]WFU32374.1 hypothetical protein QA635_38850 [Bradyrhizobium australafricanum]